MVDQYSLLGVLVALLIAILVFVVRPLGRERATTPRINTWRGLKDKMAGLSLGAIDEVPDIDDWSRTALRLVLTERPGVGKVQKVPDALHWVDEGSESYIRHLKTAASQAVLLGLAVTAGVIAFVFFFLRDGTDPLDAFGELWLVYLGNLVAITVSFLILFEVRQARRRAAEVNLEAFGCLCQLREEYSESVDPRLIEALTTVSERFTEAWKDVVDRQLEEIRELAQEVTGASSALLKLGEALARSEADEAATELAILQRLDGKVDAQSERLNDGLQLLAQPFLQGVPVLHKLATSGTELSKAVQLIPGATGDLLATSQRIEKFAKDTAQKVEVVPAEIASAIREVNAETAAAMRDTLEESMHGVGMEVRSILESTQAHLRSVTESNAIDHDQTKKLVAAVRELTAVANQLRERTEKPRRRWWRLGR